MNEGKGNTASRGRNRAGAGVLIAAMLSLCQVVASDNLTNGISAPGAPSFQAATNVLQRSSLAKAEELAREEYTKTSRRFEQEPASAEAALQAGRACFEFAEFAEKKAERAKLADQGVAACRRSLELQSNSAAAHYYLGMNLGQMARTKGWGALRLVHELEKEFLAAAAIDPSVDNAGPYRNLGYLYRDVPSFSVGDEKKARKYLELGVKQAPEYPENRLALAEGLLKWGERKNAREQVKVLEGLWPKARERFATPNFAPNWADWDNRLQDLTGHLKDNRGFLGIFPRRED